MGPAWLRQVLLQAVLVQVGRREVPNENHVQYHAKGPNVAAVRGRWLDLPREGLRRHVLSGADLRGEARPGRLAAGRGVPPGIVFGLRGAARGGIETAGEAEID